VFYNIKIISAVNLFNLFYRIGSLAPKLLNRLRKTNTLIKILFTFQALLKRLKLEDNLSCSFIDKYNSDKLLNGLLNLSLSNKDDILKNALTEREINNIHQRSVDHTECVIDIIQPLLFFQPSLSSV